MTLYVIRHASAGVRNNADPHDSRRPLDEYGLLQADLIADRLDDQPIEFVLSSPALRCQQTVAPLATRLGLEITVEPKLVEGASSSTAIELIRSLQGRTAALCSHGDVIPDILRSLEIGGSHLHGRGWAKGSIWELDNTTERIESASYLGAMAPEPAATSDH